MAGERLVCPKCGGDAMLVVIHEHGGQSVVCARCGAVVGYTSNLVKVLPKPSARE